MIRKNICLQRILGDFRVQRIARSCRVLTVSQSDAECCAVVIRSMSWIPNSHQEYLQGCTAYSERQFRSDCSGARDIREIPEDDFTSGDQPERNSAKRVKYLSLKVA